MKLTFLGTGTSGGVPMIACPCAVCNSTDERDKRLRSSVLIHSDNHSSNIVIDAGPDFRQQMLRAKVSHLNAILLTHQHKDHTAGLDDVRAFNYFQKSSIPIYLSAETEASVRREFHYAFENGPYPGLPEMMLHRIKNEPFSIEHLQFIPIQVLHYNLHVFGFRINDLTYITDANEISLEEKQKIKGSKILILNALRKEKHISHFSLKEALEIIQEFSPDVAYLTHISHQMGKHEEVSQLLPEHIHLAYDGLTIDFS